MIKLFDFHIVFNKTVLQSLRRNIVLGNLKGLLPFLYIIINTWLFLLGWRFLYLWYRTLFQVWWFVWFYCCRRFQYWLSLLHLIIILLICLIIILILLFRTIVILLYVYHVVFLCRTLTLLLSIKHFLGVIVRYNYRLSCSICHCIFTAITRRVCVDRFELLLFEHVKLFLELSLLPGDLLYLFGSVLAHCLCSSLMLGACLNHDSFGHIHVYRVLVVIDIVKVRCFN